MKKNSVNEISNISLSAKQIKSKLEDSLAYDHEKYRDTEILFDTKPNAYYKFPFSDYKIAISEELANQQLLLEHLQKYINDSVEVELIEKQEEEEILETIEEENDVNIIEEVYEFDEIEDEDEEDEDEYEEDNEEDDDLAQLPFADRAKKPRLTWIKVVDVQAVIEKIKREAIEKNKGKPVIGRRQINKMLKPYMLKKNNNMDIDGIDESFTSIDIYLNAVNKIANTQDSPLHDNSHDSLELNLNNIIEDLEK